MKQRRGEIVGFIDIGTNSVRLLVVRFDGDHAYTTVLAERERVRLGEDEFSAANTLQPEPILRTVSACQRLVALAEARGAESIVAVATAATREARNQQRFVERLKSDVGVDVRVVSGKEEARLIFLGMLTHVNLEQRQALVIDIGGGSTEIAIGTADGATDLDSLRIGAIRLASEFPKSITKSIGGDDYEAMKRRVQSLIRVPNREAPSRPIEVAYGTSGTIRNLAAIAARQRDEQRPTTLTRAEIKALAKQLRSLDLDERRALPGLSAERADLIVAGTAILETLVDAYEIETLEYLDEVGLREGLILDHLARQDEAADEKHPSVRERSVFQLARTAAFEEGHAHHVAHLSLELFDSSRASELHSIPTSARELLQYGALLHDVGAFLNYSNHNLHSAYMIRNADLLGFDQREIDYIAAIAQFHRKGKVTRRSVSSDITTAELPELRLLTGFVRLAEYLDRSHTSVIADAALHADGKRKMTLVVVANGDWELERWRLLDRQEAIESVFKRRLTIREVAEL